MDAGADPATEVGGVQAQRSAQEGQEHDGQAAAQGDEGDRDGGVVLVAVGDVGHGSDGGGAADGESRRDEQGSGAGHSEGAAEELGAGEGDCDRGHDDG